MLWCLAVDNVNVVYANELTKYHIFKQEDKTKKLKFYTLLSNLSTKEGEYIFFFAVHRSYANILIVFDFKSHHKNVFVLRWSYQT